MRFLRTTPEGKILIVDDDPNFRQALHGKTKADVVEFSAEVEGNYPLQVVRFPDVEENGSLHFTAGGPAGTCDVNTGGIIPWLARCDSLLDETGAEVI